MTYNLKFKHIYVHEKRGFVALFFVLSFSAAIALLIFGLLNSSTYMFTLFQSVRGEYNARSAAQYCLYTLVHNKISNIDYVPNIGLSFSAPHQSMCVYNSYSSNTSASSGRGFSVDITGIDGLHTFTVRREYRILDSI